MLVRDIMTRHPAVCMPAASVQHVAQLMIDHDCGAIPVVDSEENLTPLGIITDRDITCRIVARSRIPDSLTARDIMTSPVLTVAPTADVDECCRLMTAARVRRVPVVDNGGQLIGIVSQADIVYRATTERAAGVVRDVSHPSGVPSRIHETTSY